MPKRRGGYSKKKKYNKYSQGKYGRGNNWASNAPALARTALKTAKWVASIVNTEYKFGDRMISHEMDNTAWTVIPLTDIAQGDDSTQRNGRSVLIKSIYLQLKLRLIHPADFDSGVARVMLIRDNTCDGVYPNMADIVVNSGGDDTIVTTFRNILDAPTNKYNILYDRRFSLDIDFKDEIYFSIYKKFYRNHIKYLGTDASIASQGPGSLFLAFCSTGAATVGGNKPMDLVGNTRFRYIDN